MVGVLVKCSLFLHAIIVIFLITMTNNLVGNKEERTDSGSQYEEIQSIRVEKTWGQSLPQSRNLNE